MNDNHNQATDGEAKAKPEVIKLGLGVLYPDSLVDHQVLQLSIVECYGALLLQFGHGQTRLGGFPLGQLCFKLLPGRWTPPAHGGQDSWVRAIARERTSFTRPLPTRLPDKILHA